MSYECDRKIKIEIIGVIDEWSEENGIETSPAMVAELADGIFNALIWSEGEEGHEDYHVKPEVYEGEVSTNEN